MNCRELHEHFEQGRDEQGRAEQDRAESGGPDRSQFDQHIASCANCRQFVCARKQLQEGLRLVRESAIPAPESLDATVLLAYRRHVAERESANLTPIQDRWPLGRWRWALAAAVIVLSIGLYFSARTPHGRIAEEATQSPAVHLPSPPVAKKDPAQPVSLKPVQTAASQKRTPHSATHPVTRTVENAPTQVSLTQRPRPIPEEFRSLMYCDPLSCAGAMELIHVQLPSAFVTRPVSRVQRNGVVNADVLVGPDGIARGIRIEEVEQ